MRKLTVGVWAIVLAGAAHADMPPELPVLVAEEYFEAVFPQADWELFDGDGTENGQYFWGAVTNISFEGNRSAWCAAGGADGEALVPGSDCYPPRCSSWLVTPWLDLSGAVYGATVEFSYWLESESDSDFLEVRVSLDGLTYDVVWQASGGAGGWVYAQADLWDYRYEPAVKIAFVFTSDDVNQGAGAYVDDIQVTKWEAGPYNPGPGPGPFPFCGAGGGASPVGAAFLALALARLRKTGRRRPDPGPG